jgi:hypothetical protein
MKGLVSTIDIRGHVTLFDMHLSERQFRFKVPSGEYDYLLSRLKGVLSCLPFMLYD